jgi:hypothetical protein
MENKYFLFYRADVPQQLQLPGEADRWTFRGEFNSTEEVEEEIIEMENKFHAFFNLTMGMPPTKQHPFIVKIIEGRELFCTATYSEFKLKVGPRE